MASTEYSKDLVCECCGKVFTVYKAAQNRKKYCSDECRRTMENKRRSEYNKSYRKKSGAGKKKKEEPNSWVDPETGVTYFKEKRDDKLLVIDRACKKAGMSYGQYTGRCYAPRIYGAYPAVKEKEYAPPIFKWKSHPKPKKKEVITAGKETPFVSPDIKIKKAAGRPKGIPNRKRTSKYLSSSGSCTGFGNTISDILKEETK